MQSALNKSAQKKCRLPSLAAGSQKTLFLFARAEDPAQRVAYIQRQRPVTGCIIFQSRDLSARPSSYVIGHRIAKGERGTLIQPVRMGQR